MKNGLFPYVLSVVLWLSPMLSGVRPQARPRAALEAAQATTQPSRETNLPSRVQSPLTLPAPRGATRTIPHGGLSPSPAWTAEGDQEEAYYGYAVATAGDVNGDGYSDVIVGAPDYENGETNEGRVFVYHGSATGLGAVPAWTAESDQAGAWFGRWATTAGDVNGDGYSDVIVGAPYYDNGQADEGRAFVYHGSAAGLEAEPAWTTESNQVSADLGWSVGTAGDVNGDGYSDVIVGANTYDNGQQNEGRAFVYHGSAAGLASGAAWMAESDQANGAFGVSVATAGDVNGDGYSDVIVGAHGYDDDQENEGRAYVFHGSAAGLTPDPTWTVEGDQATAYLGVSVATAGDVNGDGYGDVVVGAYCYDNGETDEGRALVYYGSAAGLAANPSWTAENDDTYAGFGGSVAAAGDVNGDGYGDVIVGSPYYDNGQIGEGRAYVFHGSAAGLDSTPAWTAEGDQVFASFSSSAGTAGDVNGDGADDVIVGAWVYDNGQENEGGAFVYHGSSDRLSPMANAGPDQDVGRLAPVTLDGSTSFDPDGDYPLTYGWHQAGGAPVAFTQHLSVTTFTAPGDLAVLTFTLTVTDSLGLPSTTPDEVVIAVRGDLTFLPLVVRH